tara:strand:- start:490 stop:1122 length:633 start_codon:yes stop_codon:yes gene_type:complete
MKKIYLVYIIFLIGIKGYSQTELKIYTTYFERLGIGIEYFANEHIGIELGSSYWLKNTSNYYINADVKSKEEDFYINAMIKRYSAKKLNNAGFFYGGYIRYWTNFSTIVNEENWTIEQKDYAENNGGWRSTRSHKISLGGLIGYKTQFSNKLSFGFTFGLGSSIPASYWEKETQYDSTLITSFPTDNDILGNLLLISVIGQASINYRFGQ